ncbi:H-NS family nucleoid-associated regulatory protein (plasmid) [Leclercia adecarboxylata]|uniref:H-NS family histone-like protein n=1 Tax=Leclercia adecarboxylata TaxID=83655 RepID=UPI00254C5ABB|nr:H-NS family nucleoid-associated regulatory protein [Leclercia adecarboxylata]MDK4743874.1 H-NS family nucleoid-associated regulatory protein [Leclercia adecarboxylata]
MEDELKLLNSIHDLRAAAREMPLEFLEMALKKFRLVVRERREKESARQKVQDERNERLEKLRLLLPEKGIDPAEQVASPESDNKSVKVRTPRMARYRYQNENGKTRTWTGQGRMPKVIAEQLAAGKSLDDFLI